MISYYYGKICRVDMKDDLILTFRDVIYVADPDERNELYEQLKECEINNKTLIQNFGMVIGFNIEHISKNTDKVKEIIKWAKKFDNALSPDIKLDPDGFVFKNPYHKIKVDFNSLKDFNYICSIKDKIEHYYSKIWYNR